MAPEQTVQRPSVAIDPSRSMKPEPSGLRKGKRWHTYATLGWLVTPRGYVQLSERQKKSRNQALIAQSKSAKIARPLA